VGYDVLLLQKQNMANLAKTYRVTNGYGKFGQGYLTCDMKPILVKTILRM